MSDSNSSATRRELLVAAAVGSAAMMMPSALNAATGDIRPFTVHFPDEALADLKRRVAATRWPDQETVTGRLPGCPLGNDARSSPGTGRPTTGERSRRG